MGVFISCVGTIEETPSIQPSVEASGESVSFTGVDSCTPIGHDKIDVFFPKASVNGNSDQENMIYQVFLDGDLDESVATSIGSQLPETADGKYHIIVDGIPKATTATFVVRAFDSITGASDDNFVTCVAQTLDSELPDFDGIKEVAKLDGIQGRDSLQLKWKRANPGKTFGAGFALSGYAIKGYKIFMGKEANTLELFATVPVIDANNHPNSYKIQGFLEPGTTYFFQVNAYDEDGRVDLNTIMRSGTTNQTGTITFNGTKEVLTPAGNNGYSTLTATWDKASGDFNAYKIFAIPKYENLSTSIINSKFGVGIVDYEDHSGANGFAGITYDTSKTEFTIPGLLKNMEYDVYVIACEYDGTKCLSATGVQGHTKPQRGVTSPKLANFSGLTGWDKPSGIAGLSQANLYFAPPTGGVCEGVKIKIKGPRPNSLVGLELKTCPGDNLSDPCLVKAPSCTDSSVTVVNLVNDTIYDFQAYVYSDSQLQDETTLGQLEPPVELKYVKPNFIGIKKCTTLGATQIKCEWEHPTNTGLFSSYKIYWKPDTSNSLSPNWEVENLENKTLAKTETSYVITGLFPGQNYKIYVRPILKDGSYIYPIDDPGFVNQKTENIKLYSQGVEKISVIGAKDTSGFIYETATIEDGFVKISGSTSADVKASANGLVLLEWNEPKLDGSGDALSEILNALGDSGDANDGWHVYRSTLAPNFNGGNYSGIINGIPISGSADWEKLTIGAAIQPSIATKKSIFIDVKLSASDLGVNRGVTDATSIWYALRYEKAGSAILFSDNKANDMLIEIILPPPGMALQQRSMVNKKMCYLLGKQSVDNNGIPNPNYRCSYNGIGSVNIDGSFYYDTKGHALIDRHNLSCRADDLNPSSDQGNTYYDVRSKECFVYVDKDNPASSMATASAHEIAGVTSGYQFKFGFHYHHLGSNYKFKPIIANSPAFYQTSFFNSLTKYGFKIDPSITSLSGTAYYYSNWPTVPSILIDTSLSTASGSKYYSYSTETTRSLMIAAGTAWAETVFAGPTYRAYKNGQRAISYTLTARANTSEVFNKDFFYFYGDGTTGDNSSTFTRYSNLSWDINKQLSPTNFLPSGKGFTDGLILNRDSNYLSPALISEVFNRNYAFNDSTTDEILGLGDDISTSFRYKPKRQNGTLKTQGSSGTVWLDVPDYICAGKSDFTEAEIMLLPDVTPYFGNAIYGYQASCPEEYDYISGGEDNFRPISNINASVANYLCQSHHIEIKGKFVRKRPLSGRELVMSISPSRSDLSTYFSLDHDEYGADLITDPIYLAGQALCDTASGVCYTNPSLSIKDDYTSTSQYAPAAKWPFFAGSELKFSDQDMYYNASTDTYFSWNLYDASDFHNTGSQSLDHYGLPQYTPAYTSSNSGNDSGRYVMNAPLSSYNPSFVLGQPLWCNNSSSCSASESAYNINSMPTPFSSEKTKQIQTEVRSPAEIINIKSADSTIPMVALYNPKSYRQQKHMIHDYETETVSASDESVSKIFVVRWERLEDVPNGNIQIRCGVKIELDSNGNIKSVDNIGI